MTSNSSKKKYEKNEEENIKKSSIFSLFASGKYTKISMLQFFKLIYRSVMLIVTVIIYITEKIKHDITVPGFIKANPAIAIIIWCIFMLEMICRFFPSNVESSGSQKQFKKNFIPTGETKPVLHDNNSAVLVLLAWIAMNLVIGALHMTGIFDDGIMYIICLIYSVCDMICILFFCPFQSWFLKNKCCGSCRIYNWDYAMMFTPLFFVRSLYTWSLLAAAIILTLRWEILIYKYPERFSEKTNEYLSCANCKEKLCSHKKQLAKLWVKINLAEMAREARIKLLHKNRLLMQKKSYNENMQSSKSRQNLQSRQNMQNRKSSQGRQNMQVRQNDQNMQNSQNRQNLQNKRV